MLIDHPRDGVPAHAASGAPHPISRGLHDQLDPTITPLAIGGANRHDIPPRQPTFTFVEQAGLPVEIATVHSDRGL